jgi:hypothetical protein
MIHIRCSCGEIYHTDESHVGRGIRCPNCGNVNKIESKSPVQSTLDSRAEPVSIPTVERSGARHASRSTFCFSRQAKAAIVAGVVFGVFGIAVALDKLWPDPSSKLREESSSIVKQSVAPSTTTQPHDIQPPLVKSTPPMPNPWRQSGNLLPTPPSPANPTLFPTMNQAVQQMPVPSCARDQQKERPRTGTRITPDEEISGASKIRIKNGTQRDAAIRLVDDETGRAVRFVYIEAGDEFTIGNIEVGTYVLRFVSGYDWITTCTDFMRDPEYSEFESALTFEAAAPSNERDGYTTRYEVMLNHVPFGNAKKRTIDRERFFQGNQTVTLTP